MFEEEAKEYADKDFGMYEPTDHERYAKETDWRNGAEFGYNKGKEDADKMKSRFLELCNQKDMRIEELEKANEWHILAENPNDIPIRNSVVKVLTEDNTIQESTYFYDDYFEEMAFSNVGLIKVLAWKEIVLPKESEWR